MYRKKVADDSLIKQSFELEQKVSFIYKQEIRTGKVVKKLDYAAIVEIDSLESASKSEDRTVVNYDDLYKR